VQITLISATVTTNKSTGNLSSTGAIVTGFMTPMSFASAEAERGWRNLTVTFAGGSSEP
jgi:hypothetical protein